MVHILYNTCAGCTHFAKEIEEKIQTLFPDERLVLSDIKAVDDKRAYISHIASADKLVVVGGDGTLNHFVNGIDDVDYPFPIYCFAGGTGNDFINDVFGKSSDGLVMINDYIRDLPVVFVNGESYRFLNGIGFGIDGYCCEEGDRYKEAHCGKSPNYTRIALKGLFGAFKPVRARVTIDGLTEEHEQVWMVPCMNGRYFGGGMMITPKQDRLNPERYVSVAVVKSKSRLRLLAVFPKIFKGTHTKYEKLIKIHECKTVTVEFDKPTALQIDGETVLGVISYTVKSSALIKKEATV